MTHIYELRSAATLITDRLGAVIMNANGNPVAKTVSRQDAAKILRFSRACYRVIKGRRPRRTK